MTDYNAHLELVEDASDVRRQHDVMIHDAAAKASLDAYKVRKYWRDEFAKGSGKGAFWWALATGAAILAFITLKLAGVA